MASNIDLKIARELAAGDRHDLEVRKPPPLNPSRIVFTGTSCMWWGYRPEMLRAPDGTEVVRCPTCHGPLKSLMPLEWRQAIELEDLAYAGYREFVAWLYNRCVTMKRMSMPGAGEALQRQFTKETGLVIVHDRGPDAPAYSPDDPLPEYLH